MKRKTDKQLGMLKPIRRRDFVQGAAVATGAALTAGSLSASDFWGDHSESPGAIRADYPPVKTGMRGSHPGAYEVAHALGRDGAKFAKPAEAAEHHDLRVVGAGISGLAAA